MLLFRSEEEVDVWCREHGRPRGAVVEVGRLAELARRWYGDRLGRGWRPRTVADSQRLLAELDLTGDFWALS